MLHFLHIIRSDSLTFWNVPSFWRLQPKTAPSVAICRITSTPASIPENLSLVPLREHIPLPFFPHLLTRKLQREALLAGEEVCGELQRDGVEGAVRVLGQRRAAQLPQEHPSVVGTVPYAEHIVDFLRVENQEMQTVEKRNRMLHT